MKAPEKVYINNYNGNDTWGNQWHTKPSTNPPTVSHEYINKDALLEWLQQGFDWIKNPVISVQQIIDKLNSL